MSRSRNLLRPLLPLALLIGLAAGGGDGSVVRIDIDDPGWSVSTPGVNPGTGDIEVQLVNGRDAQVEVWVFPAPDGHEPGAPVPTGGAQRIGQGFTVVD